MTEPTPGSASFVDDAARRILEGPNFAHLATVLPDGAPHSVPVWFLLDGERVVFYTQRSSRKARNIERDPRVAMSVLDAGNPYRQAWLRGRVAERRDDDGLWEMVDRMSVAVVSAGVVHSASAQSTPSLVGTWARTTTCAELASAFRSAGISTLVNEMVVGNGFIPGVQNPRQLRDPARPCLGAVPRKHSHFFLKNGEFGSLDWNGDPVDDGRYRIRRTGSVTIFKEFPRSRSGTRSAATGSVSRPSFRKAAKRFAVRGRSPSPIPGRPGSGSVSAFSLLECARADHRRCG